MHSCATGAKSSRAAPCSSCARRANEATYWKDWASPSPPEAKSALMARAWAAGAVPEMLARAGAIDTRPEGEVGAFGLVEGGYRLTELQAQAILDMRLNRLTGLEQDKIIAEFQELLDQIRDLSDILARPERLLEVIRQELEFIRDTFGDKRRT